MAPPQSSPTAHHESVARGGLQGRIRSEARAAWRWLEELTRGEAPLALRWTLLALALYVPTQLVFNYLTNHFYVHGGYLYDAGWYADLGWRNGLSIDNPKAIATGLYGRSYFATHLSPIHVLLSGVSYLLPVDRIAHYATYTGLIYGTLSAGFLHALLAGHGLTSTRVVLGAWLVSVAFGLNGVCLAAIGYPHYEVMFASFGLLFFVALMRGRPAVAAWPFAFCLLVREDAGFHLFAILALLLLVRWRCDRKGEPSQRATAGFAAVAFGYAALAFTIKAVGFPGDQPFARMYLGDPIYGHLSLGLIGERLSVVVLSRAYLWLPSIPIALYAIHRRKPGVLIGYVACLPWTVLNLLSPAAAPGSLGVYYPFPFVLAIAWPTLYLLRPASADRSPPRRPLLRLLGHATPTALSIVGFTMAYDLTATARDLVLTHPWAPGSYATLVTFFRSPAAARATITTDESVTALVPRHIPPESILTSRDLDNRDVHSVAYFRHGLQSSLATSVVFRNALDHGYQLLGTEVVFAAAEPLDQLPGVGASLVEANPIFLALHHRDIGRWERSALRIDHDEPKGVALFGPFMTLEPGQYRATFEVQVHQVVDAGQPLFGCDVVRRSPQPLLARLEPRVGEMPSYLGHEFAHLDFAIVGDRPGKDVEFRVWHLGNASLTVHDLKLAHTAANEGR